MLCSRHLVSESERRHFESSTRECPSCMRNELAHLRATATGPERDLAEQVLAALETLAIVGACGRLYLSDEGEPLDMCSVTCDVLKGKYRYWFADTNQTARDEDGGLVTRAEALERLREKGAKA